MCSGLDWCKYYPQEDTKIIDEVNGNEKSIRMIETLIS